MTRFKKGQYVLVPAKVEEVNKDGSITVDLCGHIIPAYFVWLSKDTAEAVQPVNKAREHALRGE